MHRSTMPISSGLEDRSDEIQMLRVDGTSFPALISGRQVPYERGHAVVAVFRDIAEQKRTEELLQRVCQVPIRKEVILIDDCSSDGSADILRQLVERGDDDPFNRVKVLFHERNQGKGAALKTGFLKCTGDVLIVQDADLEYDPAEFPRLLKPIIDGTTICGHSPRAFQTIRQERTAFGRMR